MRLPSFLTLMLGCVVAASAGGAEMTLAPGEPLTPGLVAELVHKDLVARGLAAGLTVEVLEPASSLPNRAATPLLVTLSELRHEAGTGRFSARLRASLSSGEATTLAASGRVREMVEVAVPGRPIARGETIAAADLTWAPFASASLRGGTLRRPEDMAGLQAARALPAGRPVRAGDVAAPWLVRRGESASMRFTRGGLEIVGAGVALDQGRMGEAVRVQHAGSSEVRRAIVIGPREVQVDAIGSLP
jgi:flagella basal body P-ring formation protein FlgA